jgi:hypothetical protein
LLIEYEKTNLTKISVLLFGIIFISFLLTSDGHRYTIDEFLGQEMALRMTTLEPDPSYVDGISKNYFNIPIFNPWNAGLLCSNGITCYPVSIFYSITEVPLIAINHYFHFITDDTLVLSIDDFTSPHYIFWRNSENVDLVFMEFFYGPLFLSSSVVVFFLICLEHRFSRNTSIILTFVLSFSTLIWAYSGTSLNVVPSMLFLLLGYLFFKKFQRLDQNRFLLFSSCLMGFAFLIRTDIILFIIPMWVFILMIVLKRKIKINSLFLYSIPLAFSYFVMKNINTLRYTYPLDTSNSNLGTDISLFGHFLTLSASELFIPMFGILFSPGVGLFIFSPILLTVFFTFPDFFRKNKSDCILLLSFFGLNLLYHTSITDAWHGLVSWGPRYLVLMIPFLLLPLGASIEKRKKQLMFSIIIILGVIGAFFNIVYLIQDVSWFIWSTPGSSQGLYGLGDSTTQLNLHPDVIWTFQFSQLTHSILNLFEGLQYDFYLLHVFGTTTYVIIFVSSISFLSYLFLRNIRCNKMSLDNSSKNVAPQN